MEILEPKNEIIKIKNSLDPFDSKMEMTEESQWTWRQVNRNYPI